MKINKRLFFIFGLMFCNLITLFPMEAMFTRIGLFEKRDDCENLFMELLLSHQGRCILEHLSINIDYYARQLITRSKEHGALNEKELRAIPLVVSLLKKKRELFFDDTMLALMRKALISRVAALSEELLDSFLELVKALKSIYFYWLTAESKNDLIVFLSLLVKQISDFEDDEQFCRLVSGVVV